jgi:hypothetical protein
MAPLVAERETRIPLACAAAAALVFALVVPRRIAEGGYLTHVSGAWAALADDAAHGVLYRPLVSGLGYGGTRFFPIHPVLHALLVRAGLSLLDAGHLIAIAASAALVIGGAEGLRRHGASTAIAWSVGVLSLASRTAFMGAAGIRGDLLPVALGVCGLALAPRTRSESALGASLLLGLSVLAKPTLVWAPAGAVFAVVASGRRIDALKLALLTGGVISCGLLAALGWSHGEFLVSLRACASGGGLSLSKLVTSLRFLRPGDITWAFGGIGLTLARWPRSAQHPFSLAALFCLATTAFVLSSAGTHVNHLVDLCVIGALAVGAAVADESPKVAARARAVLLGATFLGLTEAVVLDGMQAKRSQLEAVVAALPPPGGGPILSEQPWIPLLAGERAFTLDAYNLRLVRHTSAAVDRDLLDDLDRCRFRTVVLLGRPEKSPWWYDNEQFGHGFREHLAASYAFAGVVGAHVLYKPKCGAPRDEGGSPDAPDSGTTILDIMERPSLLQLAANRLKSW